MHQAQRAEHVGVAQLRIETADLRGQQQALVYDGTRRKRRDVEKALAGHLAGGHFRLRPLAHHVELALQLVFAHAPAAADEHLLNIGLRSPRHAADGRPVDRRIAPTEQAEPFFGKQALDQPFRGPAGRRLDRKESHAHAVLSRRRQSEAQPGALPRKIFVRDLDHYARAIAGFRIAAAGSAVGQVEQNLDALDDDVVRFVPFDIGYEADTAGVALILRMVKSLCVREPRSERGIRHKKWLSRRHRKVVRWPTSF